jgi:hypothetical protein
MPARSPVQRVGAAKSLTRRPVSLSRCARRIDRQSYEESGALTAFGLEVQGAAMVFDDDAVRNSQPLAQECHQVTLTPLTVSVAKDVS